MLRFSVAGVTVKIGGLDALVSVEGETWGCYAGDRGPVVKMGPVYLSASKHRRVLTLRRFPRPDIEAQARAAEVLIQAATGWTNPDIEALGPQAWGSPVPLWRHAHPTGWTDGEPDYELCALCGEPMREIGYGPHPKTSGCGWHGTGLCT